MLTTNITFEKIVEKTKRMLGKNYRGDVEMVPVYSSLAPIEDHTDSFMAICNSGFTNEEIDLINEKTKNYAWWIANHGYLVGSDKKEIPTLFIYGSEVGNTTPDVLNFNGLTINGFYLPINRTTNTGEVIHTTNHFYVQFILNGEVKTYEQDFAGTNCNAVTIDGENYDVYIGRLYPEDKRIIDNNVVYPIYLVSNLDYHYIPIIGEEGENLKGAHDMKPVERNNLEILETVCEMVVHETAQWTNRKPGPRLIEECWPVIVKCSCMAYLNRGVEGLNSQTELGQQNNYMDWVDVLHKQVTNRRYVL